MQKLALLICSVGALACGLAQAENKAYETAVQSMKNEMTSGITAAGVVAIEALLPKANQSQTNQQAGQSSFVALPRLFSKQTGNPTL